jgi:16S rRNA (cytosine967-C5)-methyltransferase
MRSRRYIGSKDRAAIAERVYDVVRHYARLHWWMKRTGAGDAPRDFVIAQLALLEHVEPFRMKDLFSGEKFSPAPLQDHEIKFVESVKGQSLLHPDMPEAVQLECPPEYEDILRDYFGAAFPDEMRAMLEPALLDLRANLFLCTRDKLRESLRADKIDTTNTPYSPWGLRVKGKVFLSKAKAFHKGWVDIQDEGSQLIAHICNAQPGQQVLDYCAGGGGKTLALAAAMNRKGRIVAMDTEERRLEKGRARFKKAKISDIIEIRPLSDEKHRKWLRRQKETFDIVLADVPCTGSGTWRRNPDTRWKVYGPGLDELRAVQIEILDKIAPCVKKGGRLVYATCSIFPAENEEQVAAFLERHPDFKVHKICIPCESRDLKRPQEDPRFRGEDIEGEFMRLTPHRHGTDGFFAAVLVKN